MIGYRDAAPAALEECLDVRDLYPPPATLPCPDCEREIPRHGLDAIDVRPCGCPVVPPEPEGYVPAFECRLCGEPAMGHGYRLELPPHLRAGDPCRECDGGTYAPGDSTEKAYRAPAPSSGSDRAGWITGHDPTTVRAGWFLAVSAGALRTGLERDHGWAAYHDALRRWRDLDGVTLAGWEIVAGWRHWIGRDVGAAEPDRVTLRILSDVPGELPEAPGTLARVLTVSSPDGAPRHVYERLDARGPVGRRIVRAIDPLGRLRWLGMRPPGASGH